MVELYEYERPYFFNWPPTLESSPLSDSSDPGRRREDNLRRTRTHLRRLIVANATPGAFGCIPKFVTYTFGSEVKSLEDAMALWGKFARRLRDCFGAPRYTSVIEWQPRSGRAHFHVVHYNMPYITGLKRVLARMWGNGFVKVIATKEVKSLGAYVSKYLQKGNLDPRLQRKKAYFSSRGLVCPFQIRQEEDVRDFLARDILHADGTDEFESVRFGTIRYTRYYRHKNK